MIYELRTTRVRSGGLPEFARRLEAALPARERHSKLAGCWHTEIGRLLRVIELWPYEDRRHQAEVAAALARDGGQPVADGDLVHEVTVDLLEPAPFMRPLDGTPQKVGPVFELRIYQTRAGQIPNVIERWAPLVPGREALSPLLGAWHDELGRWYHLWPYPDLAARTRTRDEATRTGLWPPKTTEFLLTMENMILLPAAFSPIQ